MTRKTKVLGYEETQYPNGNRIEARYVGQVPKYKFVNEIAEYSRYNTKNWISERTGETGSSFELELVKRYPGKIICYDNSTKRIIKIISVK